MGHIEEGVDVYSSIPKIHISHACMSHVTRTSIWRKKKMKSKNRKNQAVGSRPRAASPFCCKKNTIPMKNGRQGFTLKFYIQIQIQIQILHILRNHLINRIWQSFNHSLLSSSFISFRRQCTRTECVDKWTEAQNRQTPGQVDRHSKRTDVRASGRKPRTGGRRPRTGRRTDVEFRFKSI